MEKESHFDIALYQTHETENDCDLIFRTNNGRVFYCHLCPSQFIRSPKITEQYFKCINLFRSGEEYIDDFFLDDAWEWLSAVFEPLIHKFAPSTITLPGNGPPTLSDYFFAPYFVCTLDAIDDELRPKRLDTQEHGWSDPFIRADKEYLSDLQQWTQLYQISDVELRYESPQDVLIKPPSRVVIGHNSDSAGTTCFYKRFEMSFSLRHARNELMNLEKITKARLPPPPDARVCRLHGVVQGGIGLGGMLFTWIDQKSVLSQGLAKESTAELRRRWARQIKVTLEWLHECGIIWGDVKAQNVLIDKEDNAWIIDFGGSYTTGWVDEDKAGTLEGDMQGLEKIMEILS
ncbi:hypothetical protein F4782DRAFT_501924 [Xylaria castorea]|nr:hypothetical protein F4782DRAFT_501924 [Xylaria castorea]